MFILVTKKSQSDMLTPTKTTFTLVTLKWMQREDSNIHDRHLVSFSFQYYLEFMLVHFSIKLYSLVQIHVNENYNTWKI